MNKKSKWFALAMSAVLAFGTLPLFSGCAGIPGLDGLLGGQEEKVDPPATEYRVYSVTMRYNDKKIDGGILSVDLSAGSIQLTADVLKDDEADGTVTFTSGTEDVATIDASGKVTLKGAGETVITATAGTKTHSIVLSVGADDAGKTYGVTVIGGKANVTSSAEGEYVTLETVIPEHKEFVQWNFPESVEWINGNVFKMPAGDVEITAEYTDKLYTLNLIGATVVQADTTKNPEYTSGGYSETEASKHTEEYEINVYKLRYDATIKVEAIDAPDDKMFVGWDYGSTNNRAGDAGVSEYSFTMPGNTLTVWGIFSETKKVFTAGSINGYTTSTITDGAPAGGFQDYDLEGMSGFRITMAGNKGGVQGYSNENITGSQLDTTATGTQLVKTIFKNHHATQAVTVETYLTYYGNLATSGEVTIEPGETKTVYWEAGLGINKPWMGFELRSNLTSSSNVVLDMVCSMAPMYPKGDKLLSVSGKAEYVKLGGYTATNWPREKILNNDVGTTTIAVYGGNFGGSIGYLTSPISNVPKYDENNATTTIYGKVINNVTNNENPTNTLKFVVSTSANPTDESTIVAETEIVIEKIGDVILFKLEIPRTADDKGQYYFSIVKSKIDSNDSLFGHNFCVQLTYNNVLGYEGE